MSAEPVKTLPAQQSPRLVDAEAVAAILEGATNKTWKSKFDEAMKLIGGVK